MFSCLPDHVLFIIQYFSEKFIIIKSTFGQQNLESKTTFSFYFLPYCSLQVFSDILVLFGNVQSFQSPVKLGYDLRIFAEETIEIHWQDVSRGDRVELIALAAA